MDLNTANAKALIAERDEVHAELARLRAVNAELLAACEAIVSSANQIIHESKKLTNAGASAAGTASTLSSIARAAIAVARKEAP